MNKIRARIESLALRTVARSQVFLARLYTDQSGQAGWVTVLMEVGIVVIIAALVFAFWQAGGSAWVTNTLNSITKY